MSMSAACGAWRNANGEPAHEFCTGAVVLPPPDNRCGCDCHKASSGRGLPEWLLTLALTGQMPEPEPRELCSWGVGGDPANGCDRFAVRGDLCAWHFHVQEILEGRR